MGETEHKRQSPDSNRGQTTFLPGLLREATAADPARIVAVDISGDRQPTDVTLKQLDERTDDVRDMLVGAGVAAGEMVATLLPQSTAAVAAWLGISRRGAVEASINTGLEGRLLSAVIEDSTARTVICHIDFLDQVREAIEPASRIEQIIVIGDGPTDLPNAPVRILHAASVPRQTCSMGDGDHEAWTPACVLFTSGTTGRPKGVVISWEQMRQNAWHIVPTRLLTARDTFYNPFPPYHITGKAYFYSMMIAGGRSVLKPRFRTSEFWPDVNATGSTLTLLMAAMANFLLEQKPSENERDNCLEKAIIAPVISRVSDFEHRFNVSVGTVYNMTELSSPLTSDGWRNAGPNDCGLAREGMECRVVDEYDYEVPPGEVGELVVRSDTPWQLMSEYLNRHEDTVAAYRNGWFHTGDAFRMASNGRFEFIDRLKDTIRRRGENISSLALEREILGLPGIQEVAALGVPSEYGEDDVAIAVVGEAVENLEVLVAELRARLPRFMQPRYVLGFADLPKTTTNKVQKSEIKRVWRDHVIFDAEAPFSRASP